MNRKLVSTVVLIALVLLAGVSIAWAQEAGTAPAVPTSPGAAPAAAGRSGLATGLMAIGAALAVGLTALGTAFAQSRIGAAGAGTIAEKPDTTGTIILLVAIPETMVILGFVIAIVILFVL